MRTCLTTLTMRHVCLRNVVQSSSWSNHHLRARGSNSVQVWPSSVRFRPNSVEFGPAFDDIGPILVESGQYLVVVGPHEIGKIKPKSARVEVGPKLVEIGQRWVWTGPKLGEIGQARSKPVRLGRINGGRSVAELAQIWTSLAKRSRDRTDVGRDRRSVLFWSNKIGRIRSKVGQHRPS